MVQQIKDLVLSLLWLGSVLWHGNDSWPVNMPSVAKKKLDKLNIFDFSPKAKITIIVIIVITFFCAPLLFFLH